MRVSLRGLLCSGGSGYRGVTTDAAETINLAAGKLANLFNQLGVGPVDQLIENGSDKNS